MPQRLRIPAVVLLTTVALAACGDEEPAAELSYSEVQAARDSGAEAYAAYVPTISGRKVTWQGRVVASVRQFGDDYVELGVLYVDMDPEGVEPQPDVMFEIKPTRITEFLPDQTVTFDGVVRELQREQGKPILFLQVNKVK
jgi:hypothetical protein